MSVIDTLPAARGSADVRAPWWPVALIWLATGVALAVAGANVATSDGASVPQLIVGYGVGAMVTTALASTYRAQRNSRRRHPRFRVQRGLDRLAGAGTALGFAAGLADAALLATELAK